MNTKHTPGPWKVHGLRIDNGFGYTVAILPNEKRSHSSESTLADARLIAAAPDMLSLLRELIDMEGPQPGTCTWANNVAAVISNAQGE